jgi:hypothetical protein
MTMATTTTVEAATAAAGGSISVQGEQLLVHGQPLLTHLHPDVVFTPDLNMNSGFLGASFPELNSRHVIPLGHLEYELMLPLSPLCISASVAKHDLCFVYLIATSHCHIADHVCCWHHL